MTKIVPGADGQISAADAALMLGLDPKLASTDQLLKRIDRGYGGKGNGDSRFSREEITAYLAWVDQTMGNNDGKVESPELLYAESVNAKHSLLGEAQGAGLSPEDLKKLEARLAGNAFTAAGPGFDLAGLRQDREAGVIKTHLVETSYHKMLDPFKALPPEEQETLRKVLFQAFTETGQLPLAEATASGEVRLSFWEVSVQQQPGQPGFFSATVQPSSALLNPKSAQLRAEPAKRAIVQTFSRADAYHSNGSAIQDEMIDKTNKALSDPANRPALEAMHRGILNGVQDPKAFETRITPVVRALEKAYGLPSNKILVTKSQDQTLAHYEKGQIGFNLGTFRKMLADYAAARGLDPANPQHQEQLAAYAFSWAINSTSHELGHGDQQARIPNNGKTPVSREVYARVEDYKKNLAFYTEPGEPEAFLGKNGTDDYQRQPMEKDAWAIGNRAGAEALRVIGFSDQDTATILAG